MPFSYRRRRHLERLRRRRLRNNAFRLLLDGRFWSRHTETFAKTRLRRDRLPGRVSQRWGLRRGGHKPSFA
jgi:hypothetical protein